MNIYKPFREKKISFFTTFYFLFLFITLIHNSFGEEINQKVKWSKLDDLEIENCKIKWNLINEMNATIAFRYIQDNKSIDLYVSDAEGLQDLGQILKSNSKR